MVCFGAVFGPGFGLRKPTEAESGSREHNGTSRGRSAVAPARPRHNKSGTAAPSRSDFDCPIPSFCFLYILWYYIVFSEIVKGKVIEKEDFVRGMKNPTFAGQDTVFQPIRQK